MPTPRKSERSKIARLAAYEKWARCADPKTATAMARAAFDKRFVEIADPGAAIRAKIAELGIESAEGRELFTELNRMVEHARKAHFTKLARASAKSRAERAKQRKDTPKR